LSTIINGNSPSITFSDSTTQSSAGLTAASPTIASGVLTFPDATTQSSGSGVAKAWLNYNGSTTTIRASYNVSSVTRNSAGNYTVNMTTALSDTNYVVNVTADAASSGYIGTFNGNVTKTTSVFGVISYNVSGSGSDTATINVSVFR
jgi:hypothetical protein